MLYLLSTQLFDLNHQCIICGAHFVLILAQRPEKTPSGISCEIITWNHVKKGQKLTIILDPCKEVVILSESGNLLSSCLQLQLNIHRTEPSPGAGNLWRRAFPPQGLWSKLLNIVPHQKSLLGGQRFPKKKWHFRSPFLQVTGNKVEALLYSHMPIWHMLSRHWFFMSLNYSWLIFGPGW